MADLNQIELPNGSTYSFKDDSAVANITRSGTTFTATKRDGTTFTFTQQDNNTTYTFTNGGTNKFTVTPSGGTAQDVTFTASDSTKLPLTGGTLTGDLTLYREGTTANNYPARVLFSLKDTTTGKTYGSAYLAAYQDHQSTPYGVNFVLNGGGGLFIGSGESPAAHYSAKGSTYAGEATFITADDVIHLQSNGNTIANRVGFQLTTGGALVPEKADTATTNIGSIGTSSYYVANGYFTNINGVAVGSSPKFTDTTYTLGTSGNNVTLTPTGGTAQSITVPYATSAGSATSASGISQSTKIETADALNAFMGTTLRYAQCSANLVGSNTDGLIVSIPWSSKYGPQLYFDDNGYAMAHRYDNNGSWSDWKKILDENNYSSYALPLTGGTVTGVTKFKGSAASQILQSRNLVGLNTDATAQDSLYLQYGNTASDDVYFGATGGGKIYSNGTQYSGNAATATKLGSSNVGSATSPIYLNAGTATACTYSLGASTNGGTANQLAYYSGANAISSSSALYYKSVNSTATTPATRTILGVYGTTYGNTAATMISGTAGLFSYGDGGPQIDFNAGVSGSQAGALIFTDHDSAATGASWHFVSNQGDWNVTSKRFHARTGISVGTNLPTTTHNLYVNGTGSVTTSLISPILGVNATNGTSGGISLYGGAAQVEQYGIAFRYTTNQGKHGYVQGDWATYLTMSNSNSRGWVFKRYSVGGVASISTDGDAVFNGSVTIGGNTANTSGARLVYDANTQAINFKFV